MNINDIKPDTSLYAQGTIERGAALLLVKQAQDAGKDAEYRARGRTTWQGGGGWNFTHADSGEYRVAPPKPEVIEGYFLVNCNGAIYAGDALHRTAEDARARQKAAYKGYGPYKVFKAVLTEVIGA